MLSQVIPVGAEFRINTYTAHHQELPAIAMDAIGNFVIAWHSFAQDGSGTGIYAQRYNSGGVPQGGEFRVNTYTTGYQVRPSLAMTSSGAFVITWWGPDGSGYGTYAQRYDSTGEPLGAEFRVNTSTPGNQYYAKVAMDEEGNFVVTWTWESLGIYARRYSSAGVPQGGEFRVDTSGPNNKSSPSIAMDHHGNFMIAWRSDGQDGSGNGVYARLYDSFGSPRGDEFPVNSYTTGDQTQPAVAVNRQGEFLVVWGSNGQDGSGFGVYAQRFDSAGFPVGTEFRVNGQTTGHQNTPSVSVDAKGQFVVSWQHDTEGFSGYDVFARRFSAAAVPQGEEFQVNTFTMNNQRNSQVAVNWDGDFVVTWQGSVQDGGGDGIFAQRYAIVPEVTSSAFLFDSSPHRLRYRFNHDVRDSLGTDDLIVQNLTTGQVVPAREFALLYDPASNVATFLYLGSGSEAIAGVLPDGQYRATLLADGIVTPQGASPAADHQFDFFFLNGDANRDARVTLADFNILARNFGQSGTDFSRGDFTFDGVTDLDDFTFFAARFGAALPSVVTRSSSSLSLSQQVHDDERPIELLQ